ncbi:MAG TPA: nitrilase-related carbon-nitrogen hydrolase [Thermohalobaculum sp.]|nr:nitrilase-related carbon-nitrogen hydrolase [Thermohalobaculum sp.]
MAADQAAGGPDGPAVTGPAPLRLALWQPEARDETPAERLARLDAAMAALDGGADLVLTPELFLTGYNAGAAAAAERPYGPSARAAAAIARRHRTALVLGYPERADDGVAISALCLGPGGETLADYAKRRLMSDDERAAFRPGSVPGLIEVAGWRVGLLICWEVVVPEDVRALARAGAGAVVVPTALRRQRAVVARAVVPARAFENGVAVALANHAGREGDWDYLGESVVCGPDGRDLARGGAGEEMVLAAVDPGAPAAAWRGGCPLAELDRSQGGPAAAGAMVGHAPVAGG